MNMLEKIITEIMAERAEVRTSEPGGVITSVECELPFFDGSSILEVLNSAFAKIEAGNISVDTIRVSSVTLDMLANALDGMNVLDYRSRGLPDSLWNAELVVDCNVKLSHAIVEAGNGE